MATAKPASYGFEFICFCLEKPFAAATLPAFLALSYMYVFDKFWLLFPFYYVLSAGLPIAVFILSLVVLSWVHDGGSANWEEFMTVHNSQLASEYRGTKIPIEYVVEAYMKGDIDFKKDFLEVWMHRNQLFRFCVTLSHFQFFIKTFVLQAIGHTPVDDHKEVGDVYNRGNDFYNWFLGETMIYTSGMWQDQPDDNLEVAQRRKLDTIAKYIHLQEGEEHLDIGCGWGTLVSHFAKNYKTKSTGCTLAKEQVAWGTETAKKYGVSNNVSFLCCDYREIPNRTNNKKYNKITCLEMAEHVGIKNFQKFLIQVNNMLEDDGMFYLQIAGLRRCWQWEDLIWVLFMGKYIFPGADNSCPLGFVVNQLERSGFEVHRVENMGVHYSKTIEAWYYNWIKNENAVVAKYGKWWFRMWVVFLGWSTLIARQGSSTVFMITCNKNIKNDHSSVADPIKDHAPFNRLKTYIGKDVIASQQ